MVDKILVLPGWMTELKLYSNEHFVIQTGKLNIQGENNLVVAFSLGALVALRDWNGNGKLILINPPLPRRSLIAWFLNWCKFILAEGLFQNRQKFTKNPLKYVLEIVRCIQILQMDFSKKLDSIPKDRLILVRGKEDRFFCDDKAANFIREKRFEVIEVESGHNWSEKLEDAIITVI